MKKLIVTISLILFFFIFGRAQSEGFAQSEGVKIHYQTFGKGKSILIINGGPGFSSEGFVPLAKELAKDYQTILYDQRGTGQSKLFPLDSTTITMELMTNDIEALRKHLQIGSWMVLGHSFGGMMGNYYTAQHPERVVALIESSSGGIDLDLLNSNGITSRLTAKEQDSLTFWTTRIREGDTSSFAAYQRAKYLAPAYLYYDKHLPVVAKRLTQGNLDLNRMVWTDLQRIRYNLVHDLKNFNKPVLILQGAEDVLSLQTARKMHETFPNSKLVILEKCGHYGWLDQEEKYYSEIRSFISSIHK